MIAQARFGKQLSNIRGLALLELCIALAVVLAIVSGVAVSSIAYLNQARAVRTLTDMRAIILAAEEFYSIHALWPSNITAMHEYLSKIPDSNAWGQRYTIEHVVNRFSVSTDIPHEVTIPVGPWPIVTVVALSKGVRWCMSQTFTYGNTGRLVYEN